MTTDTTLPVTDERPALLSDHAFVSWPGILAGTVIAVAVSSLLTLFGAAIGLAVTSPFSEDGASATTVTIASAVWVALVSIYAIGVGAYLAGRMRPRVSRVVMEEVSFRDGANGLVVWALSIVVGLMLATSSVSSVSRTAVSAASATASAVAPLAEQSVDLAFAQAADAAAATGTDLPSLTERERERVVDIVRRSLVAGEIPASDRAYLERKIQAKTGVDPEQAAERLNEATKAAMQTAKETVQTVKQTTATIGFWTVFVMLIAGIGAWWAGSLGGSHRDDVDLSRTV